MSRRCSSSDGGRVFRSRKWSLLKSCRSAEYCSALLSGMPFPPSLAFLRECHFLTSCSSGYSVSLPVCIYDVQVPELDVDGAVVSDLEVQRKGPICHTDVGVEDLDLDLDTRPTRSLVRPNDMTWPRPISPGGITRRRARPP